MKKNKKVSVTKSSNTGENEVKVLSKTSKRFWTVIGSIAAILIIIFLIAAIIDIYRFFYDMHPYAGYASLGVILLLLIIFVIRPIVVALSTPCFTLDIVDEKNAKKISKSNYRKLKRVAHNIIENNDNVSDESKAKIKEAIGSHKELNNVLKEVYDKEITKDINKLINQKSTEVLLATAISQNSKFDTLTVIFVNIRMIMQIVVRCGYHPSYPQLFKLIWKVFRNALVAYTIQSLHLEDLVVSGINKLVKGTLSAIPTLNEIAKGLVQGSANALLTLRVGILTRKYLYEEYNIQAYLTNPEETNKEILEETLNESNSNIDTIISECKKRKTKEA